MANKKYNIQELQIIRNSWKDIPESVIKEDFKQKFLDRKKAVDMYIDGYNIQDIEKKTNIKHGNITRLVKRCIEIDSEGSYFGYEGLLVHNRIHTNRTTGKFSQLLADYPELKEYIEGCWVGNKKYTLEKNMNLTTLHGLFLAKCQALKIADHEYPFNTANKAYVSLYNYIKAFNKKQITKAANRENKNNLQKLKTTGYGKRYSTDPVAPYSAIQIDGHIIDALYCVEIMNNDGTIERRPATRLWLIAVIDVATRCILGYSVSQEYNYNQYDVITALQNAILPKERPPKTIDGLVYPENGGFPSTAFQELKYAMFDTIQLDNAKSHLAHNSVEKMVDVLQCSVNYGSVATPETRGIVERFFGTLESKGFHRLPSTTGSNIKDPKRGNPEQAAVDKVITYEEIVQLLDIMIANYNNAPHSSLNNLSPLECMRRKVFESGMFPTIADAKMIKEIERLSFMTIERTVRGGNSAKRAYISYEGVEYRSNKLSASYEYIGEKINIIVDPRDISEVEAYTLDGRYIGVLRARGEFGTISHSLKTRKEALKCQRERGKVSSDFDRPIMAYEKQLNARGKTSRRDATKADIVRRDAGENKPSITNDKVKTTPTPIKNMIGTVDSELYKINDPDELLIKGWANG